MSDSEERQNGSSIKDSAPLSWAVVEFNEDVDCDIDRFIDLVPSVWILSSRTLCWYPMSHHKSTVGKLARSCENPDTKWDCFSMTIIEDNIGKFLTVMLFI